MKKFFLGLLALMVSASVLAERVTQEDAALVANNFMNGAAANTGAKKAPAKRMVLKQAPAAQANQYFIYENANGEGWVLVAANDVAHPILAYSETGHFRTDNQPANLKVWLNGYNRQITRAEQDDNYVANEEVQNEWRTLRKGVSPKKATPVVSPLIKTGWDQDSPYWNLCPQKSSSRCYTGCVATAMAQVMNYHQWPKKGTGSHTIPGTSRTADFGNTTYDWDNMLDTYGSSATNAQKNAVATLMYHCGVAVDMQYGTASEGGSGAYTIDFNGYWSGEGKMCAEKALTQFFGYKSSTVTGYYRDGSAEDGMRSWTKPEWIAMLKEELDAQRPIMYAGAGYEDPNDEETGYGHSFVCDGYDSSDKFHFNWGWSNSCDGYYDVDALEPSEPGSGGGNGEYNLEQDVIVGIIPDKKGLPMVTVTWSVDGNETTSQIMQTDPLVLPADPADCDGEGGKKFVGWTAQSEVDGEAPSDLFTTAGDKTVTEPVTYYAVFATAEEGGGEEITKASSIAVGDKVILVYETGKMELTSFSTGSTVYGIGSSYSGTPNGAYIFNVVAGSTTGSFAFENGGKYWNWSSGNSLSTATSISANSSWTVSFSSGDAYIVNVSDDSRSIQWNTSSPRFACYTSSQTAVQLYKKAAGTSYSNYSLSCGATVVCELSSIELNTADVKKSFKQNEAFTYSGLVVTAHFNNCSDKTVAPTSVSTPDMSTAGNKTITVSYTKGGITKTATYEITVTELPKYTIRFYNNGVQVGETQQVTEGQQAVKPSNPSAGCDDYTFEGWSTAVVAGEVTEMPTLVTNFAATHDQDYYAVYSITEEEEGGGSGNITLNPASVSSFPYQGITLSVTDGTLTNGTDYRVYKNQTLTIESSVGAMSSIAFTYSSASYDGGGWAASYTPNAASWTSPTASGEQARITQIVITIGNGSSSTTYYTTAPTCEECTAAVTVTKGTEANGTFALNKVGEQSTCSSKLVVIVSDIEPAHGYLFKEITQTGIEGAIIDQNAKTVTYAKKTNGASTINVVFEEKPKYAIRFYDKGILVKTQEVYEGDEATKPADPTAACDDYTFVGWWTAELAADNKTAQSWVSDFTATKDQDYYAIYSKTETEEGGSTAFDGSTPGTYKIYADVNGTKYYAKSVEALSSSNKKITSTTTEAEAVEYTFTKVEGGFTISNGDNYLSYGTSGTNINLVTTPYTWNIAASTSGKGTWRVKATTGTNRALAFSASSATNVFGGYSTGNITGEEVSGAYYYDVEIGGSGPVSTTYYSSVVTCSGTAIEITQVGGEKAIKRIENGQIVIVRGNEKYTIFGQKIQ